MADFGGDVEAFRTEVRDWLEANFPPWPLPQASAAAAAGPAADPNGEDANSTLVGR